MNKNVQIAVITLVALMVLTCLFGCGKKEVYVPSKWGVTEFVKEIRSVWYITSEEIKFEGDLSIERKVVQRIWEADRDGKTPEEISKAFDTRSLKDILEDGI